MITVASRRRFRGSGLMAAVLAAFLPSSLHADLFVGSISLNTVLQPMPVGNVTYMTFTKTDPVTLNYKP